MVSRDDIRLRRDVSGRVRCVTAVCEVGLTLHSLTFGGLASSLIEGFLDGCWKGQKEGELND